MIHRNGETRVSIATRRMTAFGALLLTLAAGFSPPAHASVQMTQFGVDQTPPPPPPPSVTTGHAAPSGAQPLATGITGAVDPTVEYPSLIRSQSTLSALDNNLFGESVDYYTGATDFVATDVTVPTNFALPMAVSRRYHIGNRLGGTLSGQFGDWDLDLPHIEVVLATSVGWQVSGTGPYNVCSNFKAPNDATVTAGTVTTDFPAAEYSQGYQLVIPGQGRRELLLRNASNYQAPANDYQAYPVITHDWWAATCKSSSTPRTITQPQQDFVVTSPNGVTYTFTYYTTRDYASYQRIADDQTSPNGTLAVLPRQQGLMLPDKIEDRYGNWIQYGYVRDTSLLYHVNKITSSDGHTITFTLNNDYTISKVEDNLSNEGRVWNYTYTAGVLTKVTLPDATTWTIDFSKLNTASWQYANATCTSLPTPTYPTGSSITGTGANATVIGTLTHPAGATGTFTFTLTRHGRNNAPSTCLTNAANTSFAALQPGLFDVLSLTKKAISGPNLPSTYTWNLAYGGCITSGCTQTANTTTVTDARSFDTKYTFGAVYNTGNSTDTEGQLQKIESGGTGGTGFLRTDSYTYTSSCGTGCPTTMGQPAQVRGDMVPLSTLRPTSIHTISQDGATYTQTLSSPDAYGYATSVKRVGTDTKTDTLTYSHDVDLWVLGTLTERDSNSKAEFKVLLDSFDDPKELDRFGLKIATYGYHDDGTLETVTDGKSQSTTYEVYKSGIPTSTSYFNGDSESAIVRWDGRVTQRTDADGNTTIYGYDSGGRVNDITYPTDTPAFTDRLITWTTSGTSGWTKTEKIGTTYLRTTAYDAFLHPVTVNENSTRYWARSFDPDGRKTFESYPASSANPTTGTKFAFDSIGRLTTTTDAATNTTTYTPAKNQVIVKDRDGNKTTTTFKQYDNPSLDWPVTISNLISTTSIGRDTWGKVTSVTRSGIERDRGYNTSEQLDSITDPERSDAITFAYDTAGNLQYVKRNGTTAETRAYDSRNRLTSITYASGDPSVSFNWWPAGEIKSQGRGSNSHSYTYNARRKIKTETVTTNSGTYGLSYAYDALNHATSFTYPDKSSVSFNPDALGQPASIGTFANTLVFFPNGAVESFNYGNGIAHAMRQTTDNRQLPKEVSDAGVDDLTYVYDDNAQPLTITDSHSGAKLTRTLGYDSSNRLTSADAPNAWGNTAFTYDDAKGTDTLTEDQTGNVDTKFTIDATTNLPDNIKVGTTTTNLTWDGEGNLSQKGTGATANVFTFDSANELVQLVQPGFVYTYAYDGRNNRATRTTDNGSGTSQQIDSVYDSIGRLVYESSATAPPADRIFANGFETPVAATQTTRYVYLGTHALAKSVTAGSTTTTTYLHTDALGSPIAQTDASKNILGTSVFLPYGGLSSSTGTGSAAGLGFAGASSDPSGLVYMHARYLDPQLRRFISLDPVDVNGTTALNFNRLSYADNNPYAKYDPSGRSSVTTMINEGAEGCGPVTCAFWAAGLAIYQFGSLGFASAHDPVRDAYDNGQITGQQYFEFGIGGGVENVTDAAIGGIIISDLVGAGEVASETANFVRHYTTSDSAALIDADGTIVPGANSGKIWVTTDEYANGADAQAGLALSRTPNGYYEIPDYSVDNLSDASPVAPDNGQPGGGTEMTTDQAIDVSDIPFTSFDGG